MDSPRDGIHQHCVPPGDAVKPPYASGSRQEPGFTRFQPNRVCAILSALALECLMSSNLQYYGIPRKAALALVRALFLAGLCLTRGSLAAPGFPASGTNRPKRERR